jgi:serine protease inhibitor
MHMTKNLICSKNQLRAAALTGVTALAMAGCGSAAPQPAPPAPVIVHGVALREPRADPRPYGAADTAFGLNMLGAWCQAHPQANLVLSPSSLASGLGMAYLGARGSTAQAMAAVLHLPAASGPALEAGLQARSAALRGLDSPGVTVSGSDQVWADPKLTTLSSYLNAVATGYDAGLAQAPLLSNPDRAVAEIDRWVEGATRGQIPRLLAPGSLNGIGWVLTDALYMHAAWATPFPASATSPGSFTTAAGRQVTAQLMQGDGPYRTVSEGGWTAAWLPYRGGKLAMVALLPPAGAAACAMPATTTLGTMTAALAAAGTAGSPGVVLHGIVLPRINLSVNVSMKSLLAGLGMGVAFTPSADFHGLSPQACCIGLVQQADTLQVGEQGTTASAATAVGILPTAARPAYLPIYFDRPYLMLVTDAATGEPLFAARVADPTAR